MLYRLLQEHRGEGTPAGMEELVGLLIGALESGQAGGEAPEPGSPIVAAGATHGRELFERGFSVEQVIEEYGRFVAIIARLAARDPVPVSAGELATLNRCIQAALAEAVGEYERRRDQFIADTNTRVTGERVGFLGHELRNFLQTAVLAFAAVKSGSVGVDGATARVIDRSLLGLRDLIDHALADVRLAAGVPSQLEPVPLDAFIAEVGVAADLAAKVKGCGLTVLPVAPGTLIRVDKQLVFAAVQNLLQNAFKFTHPHTEVVLSARAAGSRVLIEVEDQCGGLPPGKADSMFLPFKQHHADRTGLGLGLTISQRAVEASGGKLYVRDCPGSGCVFTIDLPVHHEIDVKAEADGATSAPKLRVAARG